MLVIIYDVNVDITTKKLDVSTLHAEIEATGYPVNGITVTGNRFEVSFEDEETPVTVVDAIVLAHSGDEMPKFKFHVSSPLMQQEQEINRREEWQVLAGVVVNPSFFMADLNKAVIVITGTVLHQGLDFEIRVVELNMSNEKRVITPRCEHSMLENADWHGFTLNNMLPPSAGEHIYQLEARLNTATMAKLKFCNVVLLEKIR